jgi:site-specific DNA-adenine methylase
MLKLFRYSGSKTRFLKYYRKPDKSIKRIVEPYLGSGAYWLNSSLPGLGYEMNSDLAEMWKWLKSCKDKDLDDLNDQVEEVKKKKDKYNVKDMNLTIGAQTYVRVNITGLCIGQLTSWSIYSKYKLPIENTKKCLNRLKDLEIVQGDAIQYIHNDDDLLFIDPPYLGTSANYMDKSKKKSLEKGYDPKDTIKIIENTNNPIIFTYGDGAKDIFPNYTWEVAAIKKVPNLRKGGVVERTDYVSYINW